MNKELDNEAKGKIIYSILKETVFFPNARKSENALRGNIETYTLLINGYLLDGRFKEQNETYPSICTEFMNIGNYEEEPVLSKVIRENVLNICNEYKESLGKEKISFKVTSSSRIKFRMKKYFELLNTAIVLNEFLKDKGINVEIAIYGNILKKEREIVIRPKVKKAWE